jgi:alpha-L-fucosidase 2
MTFFTTGLTYFRSLILLFLLFAANVSKGQGNLKLWYKQPSKQWEEALPVGNGKLAAMIYGGVTNEHIQFNEETLWTSEPRSYAHKGAY